MSYYSDYSNFFDTHDNYNIDLSEKPLHEIQLQLMSKQKLRLRYIRLMNDAQKILGREKTINFFKESKMIW